MTLATLVMRLSLVASLGHSVKGCIADSIDSIDKGPFCPGVASDLVTGLACPQQSLTSLSSTLPTYPRTSTELCTASTTINDATITAKAMNDSSIIVPLLAGNLPLITQC